MRIRLKETTKKKKKKKKPLLPHPVNFRAVSSTHACLHTVHLTVLAILSLLIEIFSRVHAKGRGEGGIAVVISVLALLLVVFRVTGYGSERVNTRQRCSFDHG